VIALRNLKQTTSTAAFLGLLGLLLTVTSYLLYPSLLFPIGHTLLYAVSFGLGFEGVVAASLVGVLPEAILLGDPVYGIKTVLLLCAVAYASKSAPKLPLFLVTFIAWPILALPTLYIGEKLTGSIVPLPQDLVLLALKDTLFALIASVVLVNGSLWAMLTGRPKFNDLFNLLTHAFAVVSATVLAGLFMLPGLRTALLAYTYSHHTSGMILVALTGVGLPVALAYNLSQYLLLHSQELLKGQLGSGLREKSFSGLSSEYWRRQDSQGVAPVPSSAHKTGPGQEPSENPVTPDRGICALRANGEVSFVNRTFRIMLNLKTNEIIGKSLESIGLPAEILKEIPEIVSRTASEGRCVREVKINQLPDKLRFFEITAQRGDTLSESNMVEDPTSTIIILRDITDRRTIESHLLQAQKLGSLGNAIARIVHSFNNTLTTIAGQASFALHTKDKDKISGSLQEILRSTESAGELVNNLLDFAEDRPNLMRLEDLSLELEKRRELLRKILGEDFELVVEKPVQPLGVVADLNLLMQAITNLVLNARESYGSNSGKIFLSLDSEVLDQDVAKLHPDARAGRFVRLKVRDQGFGMCPETLAKAFDPLFTTKNAQGHAGLGLSIVFSIIRAHDGFLIFESHPEKGTTATIYLPEHEIRPVAEQQHTESNRAVDGVPKLGSNKRGGAILVVEDEPSVRVLVAEMLNNLGYKVASCSNGSEALQKCAQDKFDLVLVDMIMPRMSGVDFVARLKDSTSTAKTLIMTGYGVKSSSTDNGARMLAKPFDMGTLAKAVEQALN